MKIFTYTLVALFACASYTFADDASVVANWQFPIAYWFPKTVSAPSVIDQSILPQALADSIGDFDPAETDFDATWASLTLQGTSGAGYPISNKNGNAASDKGAADFSGYYKVVYDQGNIYILLKYVDDDVNENEVVELMWAPYFEIPAISSLSTVSGFEKQATHARYAQFGAYKAAFKSAGFNGAMIVDFNVTGTGKITWSGTDAVLASALAYTNKTSLGSKTFKAIYTIGYQALTSNAYTVGNARPSFTNASWRALNAGRGISFDIKVSDTDTDDQLNSAASPVEQPQEYWWSSTNNDGYAETYYAGFIGIRGAITALNTIVADKASVFSKITSDVIELKSATNLEIFDSMGKRVLSAAKTNRLELSSLQKGLYIVRAKNESVKVIKY